MGVGGREPQGNELHRPRLHRSGLHTPSTERLEPQGLRGAAGLPVAVGEGSLGWVFLLHLAQRCSGTDP